MKLLLACEKIDVNLTQSHDFTPLFSACMNDQAEIVEMLIGVQECDVNKGPNGQTPLLIAVARNFVDIVTLLLKRTDLDLNVRNNVCFRLSKETHHL